MRSAGSLAACQSGQAGNGAPGRIGMSFFDWLQVCATLPVGSPPVRRVADQWYGNCA